MKLYRRRNFFDDLSEYLFVLLVVLGGLCAIAYQIYKLGFVRIAIFVGSMLISGAVGSIVAGIIIKVIMYLRYCKANSELISREPDRKGWRVKFNYLFRIPSSINEKQELIGLMVSGILLGFSVCGFFWIFYAFTHAEVFE
jgi:hypothetical protein